MTGYREHGITYSHGTSATVRSIERKILLATVEQMVKHISG